MNVQRFLPKTTRPRRKRTGGELPISPYPIQQKLLDCQANVIGFGGSAGGSKSIAILFLAYLRHHKSLILRKTYTNLREIISRSKEMFRHLGDYNSMEKTWVFPDGKTIEFGYLQYLDDRENYRGREHDLLAIDEATEIPGGAETVQYLQAWVRSPDPNQLCQTVLTFNPPTNQEGWWVVDWFGPWWLDEIYADGHQVFAVGSDIYPSAELVEVDGLLLAPQSKTFIRAGLKDNPTMDTPTYRAKLFGLPEPLRSQLLYGKIVELKDDFYQIIPRAWVEAAQARWQPAPPGELIAVGVDVARGGKDQTILCKVHSGGWIAPLVKVAGKDSQTGAEVVALLQQHHWGEATIALDVVGVGSSPLDLLHQLDIAVLPINGGEAGQGLDKTGKLGFFNKRAQLWWRLRESLDPEGSNPIALPPDPQLLADLTAPRWELRNWKIKVESKDEIKKRLGRSPDCGDALTYAHHGAASHFQQSPIRLSGRPRTAPRLVEGW